jgi:hypothetical protein
MKRVAQKDSNVARQLLVLVFGALHSQYVTPDAMEADAGIAENLQVSRANVTCS